MNMTVALPGLAVATAGQPAARGSQGDEDAKSFDNLLAPAAAEDRPSQGNRRKAEAAEAKPTWSNSSTAAAQESEGDAPVLDGAPALDEETESDAEAALALLLTDAPDPANKPQPSLDGDVPPVQADAGDDGLSGKPDPARKLLDALARVSERAEQAAKESVAAPDVEQQAVDAGEPVSEPRASTGEKPAMTQTASSVVQIANNASQDQQRSGERGAGNRGQQKTVATAERPGQAQPAAADEPVKQGNASPTQVANNSSDDASSTRPKTTLPLQGQSAQLAGKVDVVGFSAAMAPSPGQTLSVTSAGVVAAIDAEPTWRQALVGTASLGATPGTAAQSGTSTLKIQLNPLELGMVTARLTATGEQLAIEIQVQSSEAHRRLSSDHDAIVKALRAVGYDVDRVIIQQSPSSANASNQQANTDSRGSDAFDQAAKQGDHAGNGQERGRTAGGNAEGIAQSDQVADRSSGGIYI
ncbi:flagellar hook-length control protein FliK [Aminobacter sp. J44]|uniref:flagellar hook-length control protein FliK n=1 Tax=Aminobacter sp. J44 TaxID=935262 RepID=UPI00119B5AD5|nr:flagellar hook-length control protein FliK [Aminobacter sp. J44]TWG49368.1 flagellar hook-length control protein FliK [Aminobacter sp. J44]